MRVCPGSRQPVSADHHTAGRVCPVCLENPLRNVQSDRVSLPHGRLPRVMFNTSTLAHQGRWGASTLRPTKNSEHVAEHQSLIPGKKVPSQPLDVEPFAVKHVMAFEAPFCPHTGLLLIGPLRAGFFLTSPSPGPREAEMPGCGGPLVWVTAGYGRCG